MMIPIHSSWQENMDSFVKSVNEKGFQIINLEEEQKRISFSILLQTSEITNKKISEILLAKVPKQIQNKLFIQPNSGYHITLQWTELPPENKVVEIANELISHGEKLKAPITTITGPYASAKNLFFTVTTETSIPDIRKGLDEILIKHNLTPKLPLAFNLLWISTCRFIEQPTQEETKALFENLEQEKFNKVSFDRLVVAKNNPFYSNKSQTLKRTELVT